MSEEEIRFSFFSEVLSGPGNKKRMCDQDRNVSILNDAHNRRFAFILLRYKNYHNDNIAVNIKET